MIISTAIPVTTNSATMTVTPMMTGVLLFWALICATVMVDAASSVVNSIIVVSVALVAIEVISSTVVIVSRGVPETV